MAPRLEFDDPTYWIAVRERMTNAARAIEKVQSPECAQQILDERARRLAEPPTAEQLSGETVDVICFELSHERYAIEARYVHEVLRLQAFTPFPGAAPFVLGISNVHGQLLPIFDLRHFFRLDPKGVSDLSRVIVVGDNSAEFGVLAHEVYPVSTLSVQGLVAGNESQFGNSQAYVRGVTKDAVIMLDGGVLLKDTALFLA